MGARSVADHRANEASWRGGIARETADYDKWKPVFDQDAEDRKAAGF
jgi:hypothetical protein